MPILCYKCHKMIYHCSPEFHNIFCKLPFRNRNNSIRYNKFNINYKSNYQDNRNTFYYRNNRRNNYYNPNHNYKNNYAYNSRNFERYNRNNEEIIINSIHRSLLNLLGVNNNLMNELKTLSNLLNRINNINHDNNIDNSNDNNNNNINNSSNNLGDEDSSVSNENGLDEEITNSFPKRIVEDINKIKEKNCIICLEEFKKGDELTTVPCFHVFHPNCINKWFENNKSCPICKIEFNE